jgi:hypothetical protein
MAIDTTTPRSRRAVMAGALGGVLASLGLFAKAPEVRAGTDGDLVVDDTTLGVATTELLAVDSDPALKVTGGTTGIKAVGGTGLHGSSSAGVGVLGASNVSSPPPAINASTGVYGISLTGVGVYGASDTGHGVYAANNSSSKAAIVAEGDPGTAIHGHAGLGPPPASPANTAVFASAVGTRSGIQSWAENGIALQALSTGGLAILASGDADGIAGASSGDGTGVVGWSTNQAPPAVPAAGPAKTGVYGEATQDANSRGVFGKSSAGQGVRGEAAFGIGVVGEGGTGGGGIGVQGHGNLGVLGNGFASAPPPAVPTGSGVHGWGGVGVYGSSLQGTGLFGRSGQVAVPSGNATVRAITGVYGFCAHDASATGVAGETTVGVGTHGIATTGQGVRGEATTGVGVKAIATTGVALEVAGRAVFSRSGRVSVPANATYVDVTVPGGLSSTANVLATLQYKRGSVHVLAARPNYPSSGKVRIYLSAVASTTAATPLAWFVLG